MPEFRDAVEKRRGLQAYEEWAKQMNSYEGDCWTGRKTITYNDGRKEVFDIKTNKLIEETPRKERRRDLMNSKPFRWFLEKINFYGDNNA